MKINCAACGQPIGAEQIDLPTRMAKCLRCDEVFDLSEKFASAAAPPEVVERPINALTELSVEGSQLRLHNRAAAVDSAVHSLLYFVIVWLSFLSFFTSMSFLMPLMAGEGIVGIGFAAFSIPFWLVGFAMLALYLWATRTQRAVLIDADEIAYCMKCGWYKYRRVIPRERFAEVRMRSISLGSSGETPIDVKGVEIAYCFGSIFLPTVDNFETEWLLGELRAFLGVKEV